MAEEKRSRIDEITDDWPCAIGEDEQDGVGFGIR